MRTGAHSSCSAASPIIALHALRIAGAKSSALDIRSAADTEGRRRRGRDCGFRSSGTSNSSDGLPAYVGTPELEARGLHNEPLGVDLVEPQVLFALQRGGGERQGGGRRPPVAARCRGMPAQDLDHPAGSGSARPRPAHAQRCAAPAGEGAAASQSRMITREVRHVSRPRPLAACLSCPLR